MATKVLSISLGSEIVKVCEVMLAGKRKVQVFNAIDLIVPEGLCEDGVILDAEALAGAIKQGLKGEGFSAKKIVFTINSKRIANKEAIIPFCKENRIKDIVQINASEYFPISNLDNYTFNHSIIEVVQNESVKNYRLSVTATPNELIEQYYELARAMGMSVEAIDYSGNSILQLLKLQTAGEGVDAVLQVGAENTVVNIMNGSTMVMQRSVPYGRLSLADAVKSSANVSDEEADEMLMQDDIGDLASKYGDVADAVRTMLSSIGRILEFYRARNAENPVERVFVIGDVSSIAGLPDLINNEMDYEVQVVERLRGVEIKNHKVLSDEIVANYLANIGAVIAPLRIAIDEARQRGEKVKSDKLPWWILVFAAVIAIAMCGGILFVYYTNKQENESLKAQIEALGDVENLQAEYDRAQADLQTMQNWYDTTKGGNETLARFVDDLEKVQPSAVAITKLTSNAGEVTIQGNSYGKPATAEFVIQLKRLPYIQNVKVDYINESIKDYSADDSFQLTLTLLYQDPKQSDSDDSEATEPVAEESSLSENSEEAAEIPVSEDSETAETGANEEGNAVEGSVEIEESSEDGGARPVEGGVE
ncbi:MAG: pilus assembly protein PilM [Lachnospiraceae bacterium]|nr:pilus assembly protein PilM [Lachnospiraceae bacterium]